MINKVEEYEIIRRLRRAPNDAAGIAAGYDAANIIEELTEALRKIQNLGRDETDVEIARTALQRMKRAAPVCTEAAKS